MFFLYRNAGQIYDIVLPKIWMRPQAANNAFRHTNGNSFLRIFELRICLYKNEGRKELNKLPFFSWLAYYYLSFKGDSSEVHIKLASVEGCVSLLKYEWDTKLVVYVRI